MSASPVPHADRGHCRRLHTELPESGEVWWQPPTLPPPELPKASGTAPAKRGFSDAMMRPQNRFQQIIQDMERKYATNRPLPPMQAARGAPKRARGPAEQRQDGAGVLADDAAANGDPTADAIGRGEMAGLEAETEAGGGGVGGGMGEDDVGGDVGEEEEGGDRDSCSGDKSDGSDGGGDGDSDCSSDGSWYDARRLEDDFIDDTEGLEEAGQAEDESDDASESEADFVAGDGTDGDGDYRADTAEANVGAVGSGGRAGGRGALKSSGFFVSRGPLQSEAQARRMAEREKRKRSAFELPHEHRHRRKGAPGGAEAASSSHTVSRQPSCDLSLAATSGRAADAPPGRPRGSQSQTDCSQWKALCRISFMLGAPVPDEDMPVTAERRPRGARLAAVVKDVAARAERSGVSVRKVKQLVVTHCGIKLARVEGWSRLATTMAANLTAAQISQVLTPPDAVPARAAAGADTALGLPSGLSLAAGGAGRAPDEGTARTQAKGEAPMAGSQPVMLPVALAAECSHAPGVPVVSAVALAQEAGCGWAAQQHASVPVVAVARQVSVPPPSPVQAIRAAGDASPAYAGRAAPDTPTPAAAAAAQPTTHAQLAPPGAACSPTPADTGAHVAAAYPSTRTDALDGGASGGRGGCESGGGASAVRGQAGGPSRVETPAGPVTPLEAPALLERVDALRREAEASLAILTTSDSRLSAAAAAAAESSGGGSGRRVRLPEEAIRILLTVVRCSQLEAHARAALAGQPIPLHAQGQPAPSAWLSKELLTRLCHALPLDEKALRSRLLSYSTQAAIPELVSGLRVEVERLLEAATVTVRAAYELQRAAHDALSLAASAEAQRRSKAIVSLAESSPGALVGQDVSVRRAAEPGGAKAAWHEARVIAYAADARRHTVQYAAGGAAEELDLVALSAKGGGGGANGGRAVGWRPKLPAASKPKFGWDTPSEDAVLALFDAQVRVQAKEAEWVKLGLADELATSLRGVDAAAAAAGTDSAACRALADRLRRALPNGWLNNKAIIAAYLAASRRLRDAPPALPVDSAARPPVGAASVPGEVDGASEPPTLVSPIAGRGSSDM